MARTMKDRISSRTHFTKSMKKPASAPAATATTSSSSFLNKKKHVSPPIVKSISKQPTPKLSIWNRSSSEPLPQISSSPSGVFTTKKSANVSKQASRQKPLSIRTTYSRKRTEEKAHLREVEAHQKETKPRKGSGDSADIEIGSPMESDNSSVFISTRRRSKTENVAVNKAGSSNENQQKHQQLKQEEEQLSKQDQEKSRYPAKAEKSKLISPKKPLNRSPESNQSNTYKKLLRSGKDFGVIDKRISASVGSAAASSLSHSYSRRSPVKTFTESPESSPPSSPPSKAVIIPKRKSIAKPANNKALKRESPRKSQEEKKREIQQKKLEEEPEKKQETMTRSQNIKRKTQELTSNSGSESENPTTSDESTQQQQELLQYRGVKSNRVIRDDDDSNHSTAKKQKKIANSFSGCKSSGKIEFDPGYESAPNHEQQQYEPASSTFSEKIKQKVAAIISLIPPISIPPSPTSYKSHIRRNKSDVSQTIQELFEDNKNKAENSKKLGLTELFPVTDSEIMPMEVANAPFNLYKKEKQEQEEEEQETEVQHEEIPLPSHLRFLKDEGKEEEFEIKESSKRLIDIVFCCDTTSSMGDYLHATIDEIAAIYKKTQPFSQIIDVKYGFVCYRDHHPEESTYLYRISNLGSALSTIQFIQREDASGGGDTPEAVMDGLYVATAGINWRSFSRKYIIHIADAPPHGDIYTGVRGGFLERSFQWHDGCPCGLSIEKIARIMNSLKIHYRLIRAGSNMSRMAAIFKSCIQHYAEMKVSSPKGLDFILSDMIAKECLNKEDISEDFNRTNTPEKHRRQQFSQQEKNLELQQYKEQKEMHESFEKQEGKKKENLNRSIQSEKALEFEKLLLKKYEEVLAAKNAFMEQLEEEKESDGRIDGESILFTRSKRNRSKTNSEQTGQSEEGEELEEYNHMRKNNIFEEYYNNYSKNNNDNNNNNNNNTQESAVEMKPLNTRRRSILF